MKQTYGTNDSYHKDKDSEPEVEPEATPEVVKPNFAEMGPVVQLQNEGKLEEAWNLMKTLSTFDYLKQKDPTGMEIFEATNEAGDYQAAFDMSMKHNMAKYGAEPLRMWGYSDDIIEQYSASETEEDYSEWIPIIELQNEGKFEEAWNLMKNLDSFDQLIEKDPEGMSKLIDANENGYFQEAFDGMMIHNISSYGADVIRAWGYDSSLVSKYEKMSKWIPIMKLQQDGNLEAAWEEMKQLPDFWEKVKTNPQMKEFKDLNEAGEFEQAFDQMISYKIMVIQSSLV